MEPFYEYYIVQVQTAFVANNYAEHDLTLDEEEAFAFTTYADASAHAKQVAGIVLKRQLSEQQLAEVDVDFSEDFYLQDFCQQLTKQ